MVASHISAFASWIPKISTNIDRAVAEVERSGGRLLRRGEFAKGLPYAYVADPDGYEIEIWFE